ncbi:MAG: aminoglycoside phosphotransferase family protein [Gemmatimonadetes bacterium]|nr:aminoglycoside phosphotransferase family protein [Gemmatimonadota bacterium]
MPFTAPAVMPMRAVATEIPPLEIAGQAQTLRTSGCAILVWRSVAVAARAGAVRAPGDRPSATHHRVGAMWKHELDPAQAASALLRAGLSLRPEQLVLERRDERWLVGLPGRRLAWFAATAEGERSLAVERRVLRLLRARCSFRVPEVLFVDPLGEFEIRTMVGMPVDVAAIMRRLRTDPATERRVGEQIGRILAEQHTRIAAREVEGWLPRTLTGPLPLERVPPQLEGVVPDRPDLHAAASEVLARYDALSVAPGDHALIHTDVGFHNLAIEKDGISVTGLFDYDSAAWGDRHHDFRILIYDLERPGLLKAAMEAYGRATGIALCSERILLYNAVVAFSYLAYRVGARPEERPCGRTLDEDLRWCEWAAEKVLGTGRRRLFGHAVPDE